jgi:hypothetical protein
MHRLRIFFLIGVTVLLAAAPIRAQNDFPLVVFIEEPRTLNMASVTDNGPDGLTRLAEMFQRLGAQTTLVRLREPLPEDADVVVLVSPRRAIPTDYLARLWIQMERGSNLLVAIDPSGQERATTETAAGGLARLLSLDYGVLLFNGLLMRPEFNYESIRDLERSLVIGYPDPQAHPVIAPLLAYDVPVLAWGARHVGAELFGIDSEAFPLLYTEPVYAETDTRVFNLSEPQPLDINIGADAQGRLTLGAVGTNARTNTRVALLADGEMLQNGYGLARVSGVQGTAPLYAGDTVLAERLAAWLLELPEDQYPPLPGGFTWVSIDGEVNDWDAVIPITVQTESVVNVLPLRIQQTRAFRNESFLYILVETAANADADAQLELQLDSRGSGTPDVTVIASPNGIFQRGDDGSLTLVPEAKMAVGTAIELRLPLRVTGIAARIPGMCLTTTRSLAFPTPPDCLTSPTEVVNTGALDPSELYLPPGMLVSVITNDVANLRTGPGTNFDVVTAFRNGRVLAAIGRNEDGDWLRVQNARYDGWMSELVLTVSGDPMLLPVLEIP